MNVPRLHQRLRLLFLAMAAVALAACGGDPAADARRDSSAPESIRPAPAFALETLEGDTLTLARLEESYGAILMNFWASWCGPCRTEVPELVELHEEYKDRRFTVLGVTVNDLPRDSRDSARKWGMTYASVIGTPAMLEDYALSPWLPTTLLVVDGGIVKEWVGPRVRADFEYPVKVALGLAPPLEAVLTDSTAPPGDQRGE
ncbi:hypothetical protein BH18GEM1_BH18GEM1_03270 [soil metagenome]